MPINLPQNGWTACVPKITVDPKDAESYISYLNKVGDQKGHPLNRQQAEAHFAASVQSMFNNIWMQRLRRTLKRAEASYITRFGDSEGFDHEHLQGLYCPGWRTPGKWGSKRMRTMLIELRREHEERQAEEYAEEQGREDWMQGQLEMFDDRR